MKEEEVQRRVLGRLLNNPLTLAPFLLGFTIALGVFVFGAPWYLWLFSLGTGSVLSVASFITSGLLFGSTIAKEVVEEERNKALRLKAREIEDLKWKLRRDEDSRTDKAFEDLACLVETFQATASLKDGDLSTTIEISAGVQKLSDQCLVYLSKSYDLYKTIKKLSPRGPARKAMIRQRERLIEEVEKSIQKLGEIIAEVQVMNTALDPGGTSLAQVRSELDRHLQVAKEIDDWSSKADKESTFLKE